MASPLVMDYIACVLYVFLLISVVYKHLYNTSENQFFLYVLVICAVCTVADICMEISCRNVPLGQTRLVFAYAFSYIYLILRQVSAYAYILFIFVASGTIGRLFQNKIRSLSFIIPFLLTCVFILSNLITGKVFTISAGSGYQRGPYMTVLYVITYMVVLYGIVYLCRMRRYLGTQKWLAIISMYAFIAACGMIQMAYPGILVEMLSMALALLLVHLIVHWPNDYAATMGLYSWSDFREMAKRLIVVNRRSTILILRFVNANEVRTTYGEARYNSFVQETVRKITDVIRKKTYDYRIYYHPSGSLTVVFGEGYADIEKTYPELISMWTTMDKDAYTVRLGAKLCSLDFPTENMNKEDDLTGFSFIFPRYMNPDEVFFRAERVISNRGYEMYRRLPAILADGIREHRFEMYYQPIYDVKEGRFRSAEALIRLKDPEFGYVPPSLFIPTAEQRNLIRPIGNYVLDSVFRFAARPDFEELGLRYIELNLSVEQLIQENLVSEIQALQEKYHLPSLRINLEITESAAGVKSNVGQQNIAKLRDQRFTFSLDDYGTGYSNIQRAVELPLSLVKIDKGIIDKAETPKGELMIRSTIQMMHEIGFGIVGEGVETREQYQILERIGCDYIQGYYFAKPMCEEDFIAFLKRHNTPSAPEAKPEDDRHA